MHVFVYILGQKYKPSRVISDNIYITCTVRVDNVVLQIHSTFEGKDGQSSGTGGEHSLWSGT